MSWSGFAIGTDGTHPRKRQSATADPRVESPPSGEGTFVASAVTWDGLRDLAGFRAQNGCAISLYLDLDPSDTPTAATADTRVNALIDEVERSEAARRPELTHEQREGLRSDVERLRAYFEQEFDRDGTHGLAVFCASLDNLWTPLPLSASVPDAIKISRSLHLAPLVALVGRGEGALVVFVGRERGDLYRLRAGRLEEIVEQHDDTPGRHDQGGWSQARYQRHIEKLVHDHLKEVATTSRSACGGCEGRA
jgi:peptide chain release factor subunit 1